MIRKNFTPFVASKLVCLLLLLLLPHLMLAQTMRIMPIGNSITHGSSKTYSYRYNLWKKLVDANLSVEFVGSHAVNNGGNPSWPSHNGKTFTNRNEGHWGWRVDEILYGKAGQSGAGKLTDWLQGYTPDVVLMHMGTNDMFQNQSVSSTLTEMREVVRLVRQKNPSATILLAKLIPAYLQVVGPDAVNNITALNNAIPGLVQELNTTQSPVVLVEQTAGFNPTTGVDTYDGVHPNPAGEEKMAAKWFAAIQNLTKTTTNPPTTGGKIQREQWSNVSGTSISGIPLGSTPTSVSDLSQFEAPTNITDNYGARIRGYITAPATGAYTFWIAADDVAELWLSTTDNPASKVKIAAVNAWTHSREWTKSSSQISGKITLEAGKKYYIEALHKEQGGGDNLAVGWQLPNGTLERPIPGSRLTPFSGGTTTTPTQYTIQAAAGTGGTVAVSPVKAGYSSGETVKITATASSGYRFSNWSRSAAGSTNPLTLTVSGNISVTANFAKITTDPPTTSGRITREYWQNIHSSTVSAIPVGSPPTSVTQLSSFEAPINVADHYGARIRGYVTAPVSGRYTFWIAADDVAELWLSTSDNPASKVKIATVTVWTYSREWTKSVAQQSAGITLETGKRYYIEALHIEQGGGDNLAVGWQLPNGTMERPIPGNRLSPVSGLAATGAAAVLAEATFEENEVQLYPNPFSSTFTLTFSATAGKPQRIQVADLAGKIMYDALLPEQAASGYEIDLSGAALKAGMYLLRYTDATGKEGQLKLLKQ